MTDLLPTSDVATCRAILVRHSRSFALAGALLPAWCRDDAAVAYAFCRRCDDAIDRATTAGDQALRTLAAEVDDVYRPAGPQGPATTDPVLRAFAELVRRRRIPRQYVDELVLGMAMDVSGHRYRTLDDLLLYSHRVAGVVGLLMCHVMGVRDDAALRPAAHLGLAFQITNICRDVDEDAGLGRTYLPEDLRQGRTVPEVVEHLLSVADRFYRSAAAGLVALPFRAAVAIRVALLVYREIGREIARRGFDPRGRRAVVPGWRKALLVVRAVAASITEIPARLAAVARGCAAFTAPTHIVRFPHDVVG